MSLQLTIQAGSKPAGDVLLQEVPNRDTCTVASQTCKWIISDSHSITVSILTHSKRYCRTLNGCIILKYGNTIHTFRMPKNKIEKFKLYNK